MRNVKTYAKPAARISGKGYSDGLREMAGCGSMAVAVALSGGTAAKGTEENAGKVVALISGTFSVVAYGVTIST